MCTFLSLQAEIKILKDEKLSSKDSKPAADYREKELVSTNTWKAVLAETENILFLAYIYVCMDTPHEKTTLCNILLPLEISK